MGQQAQGTSPTTPNAPNTPSAGMMPGANGAAGSNPQAAAGKPGGGNPGGGYSGSPAQMLGGPGGAPMPAIPATAAGGQGKPGQPPTGGVTPDVMPGGSGYGPDMGIQNPNSPPTPGGVRDVWGTENDPRRQMNKPAVMPQEPMDYGQRWGGFQGASAYAPRSDRDFNASISQRPDDYTSYLTGIAEEGRIAPTQRTAQSYGPTVPVKKKRKSGK